MVFKLNLHELGFLETFEYAVSHIKLPELEIHEER